MSRVNLNVPYFSQLDNANRPLATCNVTCVAMAMAYFGIVGDGNGQLEDQLYRYAAANRLNIHSPYDLDKLFAWKKITNVFNPTATWAAAKNWLNQQRPIIYHGWLTRSGHIIVIRGYDDAAYNGRGAWIVNDPYGEYFTSGYDTRKRGENLLYSYDLLERLSGFAQDGQRWLHFVGPRLDAIKK